MGPFGGAGVLLMGDFAQLPPVLSTSLMAGMQIIESGGPSAHSMALAGRQTFNTFDEVIRLRRIHRQKGADAFKDSTIRLNDAATTVNGGFLREAGCHARPPRSLSALLELSNATARKYAKSSPSPRFQRDLVLRLSAGGRR